MKKIILFALMIIMSLSAFAKDDILGRWAEDISERVVADIVSDKNENSYKIFITWREDNLAQKDIYRFVANADKNGVLRYNKGVHIIRTFNKDKTFEDKIDYKNGVGSFKIKDDKLIWHDDVDKVESTFKRANKDLVKDTTLKNKYFSITLPNELKNTYEAKIKKDSIFLYHKDSKKAGFGGFAFGIKLYKDAKSHAMTIGGRKIGELKDKKGKSFDVVLIQPTDVQYDYTKPIQDSYKILYDLADNLDIVGIKGSTYIKNGGMKGKDLYKEVLKKHIQAIKEKWDSTRLEKENMSYMYNVLAVKNKNVLDKIGYAYYDSNADGIDELFIGEITLGNLKGVVYDIYTMVDKTPTHVISGGARDRYFACDIGFICREYSAGAGENGLLTYVLTENSTELFPQVGFKYDEYENKKNPWFISYDILNDKWDNVLKSAYDERIKVFKGYERFDFIPLSKFGK